MFQVPRNDYLQEDGTQEFERVSNIPSNKPATAQNLTIIIAVVSAAAILLIVSVVVAATVLACRRRTPSQRMLFREFLNLVLLNVAVTHITANDSISSVRRRRERRSSKPPSDLELCEAGFGEGFHRRSALYRASMYGECEERISRLIEGIIYYTQFLYYRSCK